MSIVAVEGPAPSPRAGRRERTSLRFKSGSETCHAWLYKPLSSRDTGALPVVVMARGLGGVKQMLFDGYARRFQDAGYACLVFDHRHLDANSGRPRRLVNADEQREDFRAAVAFARSLPGIDPEQVRKWPS